MTAITVLTVVMSLLTSILKPGSVRNVKDSMKIFIHVNLILMLSILMQEKIGWFSLLVPPWKMYKKSKGILHVRKIVLFMLKAIA